MLRAVLAVVLAAALVGATIPAIETSAGWPTPGNAKGEVTTTSGSGL